jgi:MoxR-like ATPase
MTGTSEKASGWKRMATSDKSRSTYTYTGDRALQPKIGEKDENGLPLYAYLPDSDLVDAVKLAIYLHRPLLIKGEPGCGKTRLARAVAYELQLPYEEWHIKSTSQARDGLYIYDTVGRLRDAQLAAVRFKNGEKKTWDDNPSRYVKWGPLGRALQNSQRTVMLIDEIDKADIDFPNDLLLELDEMRFEVEETMQKIQATEGAEPIIFITSNDEKDLPDAFLRRCLFHYINFPDEERLKEIVNVHCPNSAHNIVEVAVRRFLELRNMMKEDKGGGKKVSTSELIDWFRVLQLDVILSSEQTVLTQLADDQALPHASALLKSQEDQHYRKPKQSQ